MAFETRYAAVSGYWVLLLVALLGAPNSSAWAQPVVHHALEVRLDPERSRIEVEDIVSIPEGIASSGTLEFALAPAFAPQTDGQGLVALAPGRYRVSLPPQAHRLRLSWQGDLASTRDCDWLVEACRKFDTQGLYLDPGTAWYPSIDGARVTFDLRLHLPQGWRSLSQGLLDRHAHAPGGQAERWRIDQPQEGIYLLAGPFHVYERQGPQIMLRVFLRSADSDLAERYLAASERYVERFAALLGPYPYPQFAVAESFWETGWGMPSFTLLGSRVLRLPFILDTSLPHEILHNWWGNAVYIEASRGNWAEGLTAYLADHAIQAEQGQGAVYRRAALQKYADYVTRERDFPIRAFRGRHSELTQAVGYNKVLMVLHMLRSAIGDAAFFDALRRFYRDFRFRPASFDDLQRAFEKASGRDLSAFFAQWLDRPGAPELALTDVASEPASKGVHRLGFTLRQADAAFVLEVPYRVEGVSGKPIANGRVSLNQAAQRFTLELKEQPAVLRIDPEFDVFRRLDPSELPPSFGQLFGAPRLVLILPDQGLRANRDAYDGLVAAWRSRLPGLQVLSDTEPLPADAAAWVVGWDNRHAQAVVRGVAGLALDGDAFKLDGQSFTKSGHSLVVASRAPSGQALGLLASADGTSLPALAQRLTHYARFGYLVFGPGGENVLKGEWTLPDSRLVWRPSR